ncbi:Gfo/Idh/MocA family protein [Nocardia sp. BMG111209]|uniref:Gfo/Idh/MocA family protein n=1 Tax=Nocardia sp. BMG111209 TaxID=1160137 RepID=UPI00036A9154|nr:Gfo/Idh/MocA family oxidoreductase [Nocardia sp. BMG111209]
MAISLGVLGTARIVESGLLQPAAGLPGIEVGAIAARDPERAAEYAAAHGIPRVLADYEAVVDDPGVDAVYIPSPPALHGYWMRRAIEAGKHVLCEKPFTANAAEAAEIAALAAGSDLVVMEAFHSRYHPMWPRMAEVIEQQVLGRILSATATFCVPQPDPEDFRWQRALGGGAVMDLGCYPLRLLRYLFGEPGIVTARATEVSGVDAAMTVELAFPDDIPGQVRASMRTDDPLSITLQVIGSAGTLDVGMPYHPHIRGQLTLTTADGQHVDPGGFRSTYAYQLEAFRDAILEGTPIPTDAREATTVMRLIDDIYRAAGMPPCVPVPEPNSDDSQTIEEGTSCPSM